jgi:hypothetical protein
MAERVAVPDISKEEATNFSRSVVGDAFDSLGPKYAGCGPLDFALPVRIVVEKIALRRPSD